MALRCIKIAWIFPKLEEAIFALKAIDISRLNVNMSNLDIFGFLTKKVATENMRQLFSLFIKNK